MAESRATKDGKAIVSRAEWRDRLDRVLPELAVHDLARQLTEIEQQPTHACRAARIAGLDRTGVSAAAGGHSAIEASRQEDACGRTHGDSASPASVALGVMINSSS